MPAHQKPPESPPTPFSYGPQRREFDFSAFQNDLVRLARTHLPQDPAAAAATVQGHAEAVLAHYPDQLALIACGPGCSHCCVVNVAVLPPEAAVICRYLDTELEADGRLAIRQRLESLVTATRGFNEEQRLAAQRPCAFLDREGRCEIHAVRPLLCRMVTSVDPQACRRALRQQAAGNLVPVVADLFHERLFEVAFLALARALDEEGMESASGRLSEETLQRLAGNERAGKNQSDAGGF